MNKSFSCQMNGCRENPLFMFGLQILVKKKKIPPSLKNFMEIVGVKKIIHTPCKNMLEGNGVVFENFTINNLQL